MAEEEVESGSERGELESGMGAGVGADPKNGPTGALIRLRELAHDTLLEQLKLVTGAVLEHVKVEHVLIEAMLGNLATRVESEEEVTEAEYRGIAEYLARSLPDEGRGSQ